ncbi:hypothetical protein FRC12_004662 [Ceratobasidium sp. 428]|nr:hypothetical protein FRC12_004662 [Ceratobasidium sp. 428]
MAKRQALGEAITKELARIRAKKREEAREKATEEIEAKATEGVPAKVTEEAQAGPATQTTEPGSGDSSPAAQIAEP